MKIGIDLDEVLASFLSALIDWHNHVYGTSLKREQFKSYRFWETWGGTMEEAMQKVYDFHETPFFTNKVPVANSQEGVRALSQEHELYIITSRQDEVRSATMDWLERHFPNCFKEVLFSNHYARTGTPKTKKHFCDELGVQALIDDSQYYAVECLSPERKIILLDCPWNQTAELPEEIKRVYSWNEITEIL